MDELAGAERGCRWWERITPSSLVVANFSGNDVCDVCIPFFDSLALILSLTHKRTKFAPKGESKASNFVKISGFMFTFL